jgi:UDP-glucose 4-epimerase
LHRGTGYIGSFTSLALLEHGYKVVIVDSLYNSSKVSLDRIELLCGKRPEFYQVDITDEEALDKVFAAHPDIDSVIHFAALKVCSGLPELVAHADQTARLWANLVKSLLNTTVSMSAEQSPSCAACSSTMYPTLCSLHLRPCMAMRLESRT